MSYRLSSSFMKEVLEYLGCSRKPPTLRYLNRLIRAYLCRVPWESVSRILKRSSTPEATDCPRFPEEFWNDAMQYGFGGTCYESSLAFYSLLTSLGYKGYLTVNDMGPSKGCHAAIVIQLNEQKYLVDVTIPVQLAIRIDPRRTVRRRTAFHNFTIQPVGVNKYEVMRSHHPHRNAFTLIDVPVDLAHYQTILENDYSETGLFLKSVVMVKAANEKINRFFSDHQPYKVESVNRTGKMETLLEFETMSHTLAVIFQMPEDKIATALTCISNPAIEIDLQNIVQAVNV